MAIAVEYLNTGIELAKSTWTHIGIVDYYNAELVGGSPAYERQPVTWTVASDGLIRPTTDLVFNVPANAAIYYWQAYNAVTDGVGYGQIQLPYENFVEQGVFTLLAASTGIDLNS